MTILFRCLSGLPPPEAGTLIVDGADITGWRADRITGRGRIPAR